MPDMRPLTHEEIRAGRRVTIAVSDYTTPMGFAGHTGTVVGYTMAREWEVLLDNGVTADILYAPEILGGPCEGVMRKREAAKNAT